MLPQEFLAAVLPPPGNGYYCAFALPSKVHKFSENIDVIPSHAQQWVQAKKDAYFALATFKTDSREAENAAYLRCVFIDMDGYESKRAAAEALDAFLARTGLDQFGSPWVVASGGGLHCYWAFEEAVTVEKWLPVASALKALCMQENLAIDRGVTADAARVLRVPDTFNFKAKYGTPRPVRLLVTAGHLDFDAFAQAVQSKVRKAPLKLDLPAIEIAGARPAPAPKDNSSVKLLTENSTNTFKLIVKRTSAGSGCAQLGWFVDHAKDDGMEPLWRAWLSIAKHCSDGDKAAVWLSKQHPYDEERMQRKLREIKGPYSCVSFDDINGGVCGRCPHFGKITNPLALGRVVNIDNEEREIALPPAQEDDAPVVVKRPAPPKGYSYGANGGVYMGRMTEDADGSKRRVQVMLLPYNLFVVDLLNRDGEHLVHMVADRGGVTVDVLLPQRNAVSRDECVKSLAQQNIIAAFGSGNDKNLFEYVRACVEEASTNKTPVKVPAQYGWQEDDSFVYNGKVYFPDGRTRKVPMPDLANLDRITRNKGTLEGWRRFPQMLMKKGLYDHVAIACIAFGAPLMKFTQMAALTFHGGSTDSGTGKSLALSLLSSVWGHPANYRTGKGTSAVTMQQRMGNLNSLPFVSDEITHKSRQDMEWFPGFVFDAAEGQGKEKSEVHHNRERINNVAWATLVMLTSNTNMHDYLSGARAHSSQGELMRMLEWSPEQKLNWTPEEEDIIRSLISNYGVAGEKYVRWLVQNKETAMQVTADVIRALKVRWMMTGDERYWAAGCGSVVAGAILASSKYADVIDVPVEKIIEFLKKLVDRARGVLVNGTRNADDVLNMFIRDNYGSFVVLRHSKNRELLAHLGNGDPIDQSLTRSKVMGRVEHELERPGFIDFYIEEQVLKAHCVSLSFGYDQFKRMIAKGDSGFSIRFLRKDMMAKTRGPQMRVRAVCLSRQLSEAEIELGKDNALLPLASNKEG